MSKLDHHTTYTLMIRSQCTLYVCIFYKNEALVTQTKHNAKYDLDHPLI